jgi:hypothetical protein
MAPKLPALCWPWPRGGRAGEAGSLLYSGSVSVAYSLYPELHALVDRLRPERAEEARRTLLRLVQGDSPRTRRRALPVFDGPEDLSERVDEYLFGGPVPEC